MDSNLFPEMQLKKGTTNHKRLCQARLVKSITWLIIIISLSLLEFYNIHPIILSREVHEEANQYNVDYQTLKILIKYALLASQISEDITDTSSHPLLLFLISASIPMNLVGNQNCSVKSPGVWECWSAISREESICLSQYFNGIFARHCSLKY